MRHKKYNYIVAQKKRGEKMSPRTGRPHSENPKNVEVKARIDENTARRLFAYCERLGITRTEALREGIERILKDAEKKK